MYKVFFNASCITLFNKNENSPKDNKPQIVKKEATNALISNILKIEKEKTEKNLTFACDNLEDTWQKFKKQFTEITAAGGIVVDTRNRILLIKRFGKWDLPKGKVEKDEKIEKAALREVEEECGISGMNIQKSLNSIFHIYRSPFHVAPNNLILKQTYWFEMHYNGDETPRPQTEENIEEVRWFELSEMNKFYNNTYPNLKELMEHFLASY